MVRNRQKPPETASLYRPGRPETRQNPTLPRARGEQIEPVPRARGVAPPIAFGYRPAMPDRPADLVTVDAAALASGRDATTIRRWTRTGRLASWPGDVPTVGGRAPRLVSLAEVRTLAGDVAHLEAEPGPVAAPLAHVEAPGLAALVAERDGLAKVIDELRGRLDELRAERDRAIADVATMRAERDRDVAEARGHLARELARLSGDLANANRERQATAAAHLASSTALAGLVGELARYARLGPFGRLLQAPPSPLALPGPARGGDLDGDEH